MMADLGTLYVDGKKVRYGERMMMHTKGKI
jgi:hypothetical protein